MNTQELEQLCETAKLLGHLLLHELDASQLERLNQPEIRAALEAHGVDAPASGTKQELEELSADYYATFVQPANGGPLVQSLWTQGMYAGQANDAVLQLARAAGLEFDSPAARDAQRDHLGCLLLLWAQTRVSVPEVAQALGREHFAWALKPLQQLAQANEPSRSTDFYVQLARMTHEFLLAIIDDSKLAQ